MDPTLTKSLGLAALVVIILRLGWTVHQRSVSSEPIHGGGISLFFNFLSGLCFIAILPTICMSVLILHPESVDMAGLTWNPVLLIVVSFGVGSLVFSLLHALFERGPLQRAEDEKAAQDSRGWTEQDAKTSGL